MPKDFKNSPSPREPGRAGHPLLLGMIIGLLMGIVIALAVALWLNRLSNPFVEKAKPVEPLARIGPAQPPRPDDKAAPDKGAPAAPAGKAAAEKKPSDRPRFEFYTMLPGEKEVTDKEAKAAAAKAKEAPKDAGKAGAPGSSPAQPKPHTGESYWLQAGAFSEEKEADNLKAKIALTGLEASVKAVDVPGKGTLHRVRLGPYQSLDDANRIKAALSQNGVGATIIRTDEAKNP